MVIIVQFKRSKLIISDDVSPQTNSEYPLLRQLYIDLHTILMTYPQG